MGAEVLNVEFFRQCFNEFPDPVIVTDAEGRVRFLNHAAQTLLGQAIKEESPLAWSDFLRLDDDPSRRALPGRMP